jgi:ATP-dependent DNA helicase RecG
MARFRVGELDVLVATTVIEVGVDVPNATAMVVLDADRFAVSQLHQLRGRVGRGSAAGLCLLVTDAPAGTPARERLDAVASTLDGFELSRVDLEHRREGDVLGATQSGTPVEPAPALGRA